MDYEGQRVFKVNLFKSDVTIMHYPYYSGKRKQNMMLILNHWKTRLIVSFTTSMTSHTMKSS
jgi:hypothetical protein